MEKKIGYIFLIKLIEAIDEYVSLKKQNEVNYFNYKDLDFFSAFKKEVFFAMTRDNFYLKQFINKQNEINCISNIHKEILFLVFPEKKYILYHKDIRYKTKNYVKSIPILNNFYRNSYCLFSKQNTFMINEDIGFVIIHLKFIKFFEKIYDNLGNNVVFILMTNFKECVDYCKKKSYKYICYKSIIKNINTKVSVEIKNLILDYNSISNFFYKNDIKLFIIPEGNAPVYELINLYSKVNSKKTVCIQHGWSPIFHTGFKDMQYDSFLTWGKEFSKLFEAHNPNQKFLAVGNHTIGYNISLSKNNYDNKMTISFFLQAVVPLISAEDFDNFINLIINIASIHRDKRILVREHPSHPIDKMQRRLINKLDNVIFMNYDKFTLSDVLKNSTISVSIMSSTLLESLLNNSIPFIVNTTGMKNYQPDLNKLKMGVEVSTFENAFNELDLLIKDEERILLIKDNIIKKKQKFFDSCGRISQEKILKIINDELESVVE